MHCFTKVRSTFPQVKCANTTFEQFTTERRLGKNEKGRFYVGHNHFEPSQCPRVIGSAQDGERTPGAKARSGREPRSGPMRRRVENALESENRNESMKKGFEN